METLVANSQTKFISDEKIFKKSNGVLPVIESLDDLIRELRKVFENEEVNIEEIYYLMRSYKSNRADWNKFAKFDRYRYTRNLVDSGNGRYNLMALCWGEGHGSAIHDHANAHCFMKMLHGTLQEIRFAWPKSKDSEEPLEVIGRNNLNVNEVCYMNDSIGLHRVENPSNVETAVSLHLYCPPYNECCVFNQNTGQKSKAKMTFWSVYGERIKSVQGLQEPEDN